MKTLNILVPMDLAGQAAVPRKSENGYAMAALLVAMSVMSVMMAVAMPVWKQTVQREKEEELVFRGEQYARAIGLFGRKYANAFPPSMDALVEQRFLRKKYKDPITNDDFAPLLQSQATGATPGSGAATAARPGQTATQQPPTARGGLTPSTPGAPAATGPGTAAVGGLMGVTSKSKEKSIRIYKGRTRYNEWAFVYTPVTQAPGGVPGTGTPGIGTPGGAGGQGRGRQGQQPAGNPFPGMDRGGGRGAPPAGGRNPFGSGGPTPFPGSAPQFPGPTQRGR
jgi:type II secretory pathway pseudopilin PulG